MSEGMQWSPWKNLEMPSGSDVLSLESSKWDPTGLRPTELAWAAGILDGEGFFGLARGVEIAVENTSPVITDELQRLFGGSVRVSRKRTKRNKTVFRWRIYGRTAAAICMYLIPYLKEKKPQAEVMIISSRYPLRSAMRQSLVSRIQQLKRINYG